MVCSLAASYFVAHPHTLAHVLKPSLYLISKLPDAKMPYCHSTTDLEQDLEHKRNNESNELKPHGMQISPPSSQGIR
jgi:hypothetical protein